MPQATAMADALRAFNEILAQLYRQFASLFAFKKSKDAIICEAVYPFLRNLLKFRTEAINSFLDSTIGVYIL